MTTRFRTSFMAPGGFTATTPGVGKSSKIVAPKSDRKAGPAPRAQSRTPAEGKAERPGKSAAA